MDNQWKITSEKPSHKYKLFEIRKSSISNGQKTIVHENIYQPPAVGILPLTSNNELLLISEFRYLFNKRMFGLVAGYVDPGEKPIQAAKRELEEEIGYKASHWEEIGRSQKAMSVVNGTMHLFLAKDLEKTTAHPEPIEDIQMVQLSIKDAVEKVLSGEIVDLAAVSGILLLDKLRMLKRL